MAAYEGNLVTLLYLLSLPNILIDTEDDEGWTPLHVACFYNNLEVVKVLLMFDEKGESGSSLYDTQSTCRGLPRDSRRKHSVQRRVKAPH